MPNSRRGVRRWGLVTAVLVVGISVVLLAWAALERRALAERLVIDMLRRRGFPEPALQVDRFGASGIRAVDVSLGREGEITARRVSAGWSGASLADGRLERLDVQGLEVRARLVGDRVSLGSLDELLGAGEDEAGGGAVVDLPVATVRVEAARVTLDTPGGPVVLQVDGVLENGEARAALRLEPLVFAPGGLQPADLLPAFKGWGIEASGRVEGQGSARWTGGEPEVRFDFVLSGLDLELPFGSIDGLAGTLRAVGPPLALPAPERLTMARLSVGLDLTEGVVRFGLDPERVLEIEEARWNVAGGTVHTGGRIDLAAGEQRLVLRVSDVDLAQLIQSVDVAGLSGEGRLSGEFPVVRRGERLEVQGGRFAAEEGGVLRYDPEREVAALATSQAGFDVLLAALRDFRYETLSAGVDGDLLGEVRLGLHLSGRNPDLQAGRLVKLNLVIDASLLDLLRGVAQSFELPGAVERALVR